jgi:hypothetical protein
MAQQTRGQCVNPTSLATVSRHFFPHQCTPNPNTGTKDHSRFRNRVISQYRLVTQPRRFVRTKNFEENKGEDCTSSAAATSGKPCLVGVMSPNDQVTSEVVMPNHHREEEDIAEVEVNPRNPNPPRLSWNTAVYQWPNRRGRGWRAISFLFCFFK